MTSERQVSPEVSAIRRRLSPITRRLRSTVIARNPRASWNSMAGRIAISSSRTRLAGSGTPEPVASRIATSRCSGTPVLALSSSNVSSEYEANRL